MSDWEVADLASAARRAIDEAPVEVRPGLWSIPVDIPIASLKIVNVYVFEHPGGGVTLLDAGWDDHRSLTSLTEGLERTGHDLDDVRSVIVTHAHPDHLGLAHVIRARTGATVVVQQREAERLGGPRSMPVRFRRAVADRFPHWGVPHAKIADMVDPSAPVSEESWQVPVTGVADGELLDIPGWSVRAVWTPGHTGGHLCLHDPQHRLLFTGDHVLPRITPGVGSHPDEANDALGEFLASLRKVAALDVEWVMPGHEYRFTDLPGRVADLLAHHDRRLDEVESVVRAEPGATGWRVTERISWSRPLERFGAQMVRAAVAETVAHLVHLELLGRVRHTAAAGVERWVPA
ncbi:MBL fold metallo-hydrolase [Dactylosporangium sp. CA-139066]|uniref:MBL fold metallo-hydrolase n=1 Tax=Dactylosporangium sp. CA-139066 TaxID=3239930 RepID=UPI003D8D009D